MWWPLLPVTPTRFDINQDPKHAVTLHYAIVHIAWLCKCPLCGTSMEELDGLGEVAGNKEETRHVQERGTESTLDSKACVGSTEVYTRVSHHVWEMERHATRFHISLGPVLGDARLFLANKECPVIVESVEESPRRCRHIAASSPANNNSSHFLISDKRLVKSRPSGVNVPKRSLAANQTVSKLPLLATVQSQVSFRVLAQRVAWQSDSPEPRRTRGLLLKSKKTKR